MNEDRRITILKQLNMYEIYNEGWLHTSSINCSEDEINELIKGDYLRVLGKNDNRRRLTLTQKGFKLKDK